MSRLIDADELELDTEWSDYYDEFISYSTTQIENAQTIHAVPIEVLQEIKREIEGNMESIIGKYDSSTPTRNMPSAKIERNEGRKECLAIIDKYIAQYKEDAG